MRSPGQYQQQRTQKSKKAVYVPSGKSRFSGIADFLFQIKPRTKKVKVNGNSNL
jgi:hypothetical protein